MTPKPLPPSKIKTPTGIGISERDHARTGFSHPETRKETRMSPLITILVIVLIVILLLAILGRV